MNPIDVAFHPPSRRSAYGFLSRRDPGVGDTTAQRGRGISRVALGALVLIAPTQLRAQTTCRDQWSSVASSGIGARYYHAMVSDLNRSTILLFGGWNGVSLLGDTYEWTGTTTSTPIPWSLRASTGPSPRAGHSMAYDVYRKKTVLFGGQSGLGWTRMNDTWEWDGVSWTQRSTSMQPSARAWHKMAYDMARRKVVLFGGNDGSITGVTWEWDGTNWAPRSPLHSPPPRQDFAMAYDESRERILLFGGNNSSVNLNDTWEWNGKDWKKVATTGPAARSGSAMAYDRYCGKLLLHAGGGAAPESTTWRWQSDHWLQVSAGFGTRYYHAMAYDPANSKLLAFGGWATTAGSPPLGVPLADAWYWCCPCDDEAAILDANGNVIYPSDYVVGSETFDDVDKDVGYVKDLYPENDTSTDNWYHDFPCDQAIGDTVDPLASNPDWVKLLGEEKIFVTPQDLYDAMKKIEDEILDKIRLEPPPFQNAPPLSGPGPYVPPVVPHCMAPNDGVLGGYDIVFVHGFSPDQIYDRVLPSRHAQWKDPVTFNGLVENPEYFASTGYYKNDAREWWTSHINSFLKNRGNNNRYLVVSIPCHQRMETATRAVLAQIAEAMRIGTGVIDPKNPNGPPPKDFGTPGFVVVSYSTGALLTDIAMSAAAQHPQMAVDFIPKACKAHISLHGAFIGSRYATAAIAVSGFVAALDGRPREAP